MNDCSWVEYEREQALLYVSVFILLCYLISFFQRQIHTKRFHVHLLTTLSPHFLSSPSPPSSSSPSSCSSSSFVSPASSSSSLFKPSGVCFVSLLFLLPFTITASFTPASSPLPSSSFPPLASSSPSSSSSSSSSLSSPSSSSMLNGNPFLPSSLSVIHGGLAGLSCTAEAIQSANSVQLHSILAELADSTFFRLVKVDTKAPCPTQLLLADSSTNTTTTDTSFAPSQPSPSPSPPPSSPSSSSSFSSSSAVTAELEAEAEATCGIPEEDDEELTSFSSSSFPPSSAAKKKPAHSQCALTFEPTPSFSSPATPTPSPPSPSFSSSSSSSSSSSFPSSLSQTSVYAPFSALTDRVDGAISLEEQTAQHEFPVSASCDSDPLSATHTTKQNPTTADTAAACSTTATSTTTPTTTTISAVPAADLSRSTTTLSTKHTDSESAKQTVMSDSSSLSRSSSSLGADFWLDLCDFSSSSSAEYINLKLNPEQNTGYNGTLVWQALHSTAAQLNTVEGQILQRLLSGYHTSVSTHICTFYYPPPRSPRPVFTSSNSSSNAASFSSEPVNNNGNGVGVWRMNPRRFAENVFVEKEWVENLHFAFVVVARALFKAKPILYEFRYSTGNPSSDLHTQRLMQHLLDASVMNVCGSVLSAFDETIMFTHCESKERSRSATIFKDIFQKITKIMNCVTCQRCRLHANVAIHGIGAALKILLTDSHMLPSAIGREEIVALVNTLYTFSESLLLSNHLMNTYFELKQKQQSIDAQYAALNNVNILPIASTPSSSSAFNSATLQNHALACVASAHSSLSQREEDALVAAIIQPHPSIMLLARHYASMCWPFLRHSLIHLGVSTFDAIVVGSGLAGLSAAVTVADRGGYVLVLEKQAILGGNSAKASSGINSIPFPSNPSNLTNSTLNVSSSSSSSPSSFSSWNSSDAASDAFSQFLSDTLSSQGNAGSRSLALTLIQRSNSSIEWLQQVSGLRFDVVGQLGGHREARTRRTQRGLIGAELMTAMMAAIKKRQDLGRAVVKTKAEVIQLLVDTRHNNEHGQGSKQPPRVIGVEYFDAALGQSVKAYARSVVLATGGFGADRSFNRTDIALNSSMKAQYPSAGVDMVETTVNATSSPSDWNASSSTSTSSMHSNSTNSSTSKYSRTIVRSNRQPGLMQSYRPDLLSFPTTLGAFTTGDGIHLARSAPIHAKLCDMPYVQLHPTGFIDPKDRMAPTKTLAAEILRGVGGILLDRNGRRFVDELQTRKFITDKMLDKIDQALDEQQQLPVHQRDTDPTLLHSYFLLLHSRSVAAADKHVHMYASRSLLRNFTRQQVIERVSAEGVESSFNYLQDKYGEAEWYMLGEVTPVIHYTMGGVCIDTHGRVLYDDDDRDDDDGATMMMRSEKWKSKGESEGESESESVDVAASGHVIIPGLYAAGEVSGGVHGENRLGGNSLLECTVFGHLIGQEVSIVPQLTPSHFSTHIQTPNYASASASAFVSASDPRDTSSSYNSGSGGESSAAVSLTSSASLPSMRESEVGGHSVSNDCWSIIDGLVYDLSGFADDHPGGADSILEGCGLDGTDRFNKAHTKQLLLDAGFVPLAKIN